MKIKIGEPWMGILTEHSRLGSFKRFVTIYAFQIKTVQLQFITK